MSNPLVKLLVVAALLAIGGGLALGSYRARVDGYEHRLGLERVRREFLERAPLTRQVPDPVRYAEEVRALYRWYFDELTDHYNRFSGFKGYDRFLVELNERRAGKKVKEQDAALQEERFKEAWVLWERMLAARYEPAFTAHRDGLRFDVVDVESLPGVAEPQVRIHFVLSGAQRRWVEDGAMGPKARRLAVAASFRELVVRGVAADGKQVEMRVTGEPYRVDNPERFVDEFPPGLLIGHYDLPKLPAELLRAELTFEIVTRSLFSGDEMGGAFVWKLDPLPAEWRLAPGAAWEGAQEQVREPAPAARN